MALEAARLQPRDVGHVNASAAGLVTRDSLEAQAIRAELGDVPVTAPKSFFGDSGAASGAAEMAVSVAALTHGEIPVTLNYEQPDPLCPVNVIHGRPEPVGKPTALVLTQAPAGQVVAVVLERADA
jgi:3-oxoacyl-[acyl-carrier-protein] synthase II